MRANESSTMSTKKIRQTSSGGGNPWRHFVREIALPHIDRLGQGTLPSPTAGCRIRFPESLLMLPTFISQRRRFVKKRHDGSEAWKKAHQELLEATDSRG